MSDAVYRHADKALKRIYPRMRAEFQNHALRAAWDEVNVLQVSRAVDDLYARLNQYINAEYLEIAKAAYTDAEKTLANLPVENPQPAPPDNLWLILLLGAYDTKMQYQYSKEWERKRDRLKESMIAVGISADSARIANTQEGRAALKRALDLLERQVMEEADTVTDEARIKAYRDHGVERVRWVTQHDERVCRKCDERDNLIFSIDNVPPKHPRCRCYLVPVL